MALTASCPSVYLQRNIAIVMEDCEMSNDLDVDVKVQAEKEKQLIKSYQKIMADIRSLDKKLKKVDQTLPGALVGRYGELFALCELIKRGFQPEYRGKRFKADIFIPKLNKYIEVKFDRVKKLHYVGWDGIKPNKFDYLIGIIADQNFEIKDIYIFPKKVAELFPTHNEVGWGKKPDPNVRAVRIYHDKSRLMKDFKQKPIALVKLQKLHDTLSNYNNRWDLII